jgi:alpha-glucosidase
MNACPWWRCGIVYQIYPLSYQDSTGDGCGDLNGIRRRLDYLVWLGVDAIWVSPIYPSPMADMGYDVADYCDVDPRFGTIDDFDALLREAHQLGLKVILDFVPNHTSEQHPWFRESRAARDNPKRDWYLWQDPAPDGAPPNNWVSEFGGSAWQWDETSGQYYYHAFLKEQPDLNWRNPAVRHAMYDAMRFWLARGVDGFRIDVLWHLIKDEKWRDDPPNPGWQPGDPGSRRLLRVHSSDQDEVFEIVREMRQVSDEFPARVLIGELYLPLERLVAYYGTHGDGVQLPFNFHLLLAPWDAAEIRRIIAAYSRLVPEGEWPNYVLGNHDQPRLAARLGARQARVAAMLLLTLRGTPTLYYGDEIGMTDVEIPTDRLQDARERNEPGMGLARDPQRTPMQWDRSLHAGFSSTEPWLPVSPDAGERNVEHLAADARSILTLYRRLAILRRAHRALAVGDKTLWDVPPPLLAYQRSFDGERFLVVVNLSHEAQTLPLDGAAGSIVLSTGLDRETQVVRDVLALGADEGVIVALERVPG